MQCAYCGSSALHCSMLMVLCMHDTQIVSPPDVTRVYSATVLYYVSLPGSSVFCSVVTQKERQVCSPFVKALHWVIFCWTFSVCATYRLCRHLVHHKCAMYRVLLCCVLFCVNCTPRAAVCCCVLWIYTYSIVNDLHCYIFYGDFLYAIEILVS
jgi:hypothetical protein